MNSVFKRLLDKGVVIYLDYILIYSKNVAEHTKLLNEVFEMLNEFKLYVKADKCALLLESVEFLGHTIFKLGSTCRIRKYFCR
jgi:Reverse transcriptase (RNA-dependent DNA polymerase)